MAYQTRSARRTARKSKHNIVAVAIISVVLLYATLAWILPTFVNGIGFVTHIFKPSSKQQNVTEEATLAPPVLVIPFEATNSGQIDISGYATAGSKVKIYVDDELQNEVDVKDDGSFTVSGISLNLGTNNIYGKTVDEKGKESLPSKTIKLTYDNEKPSLEVTEPNDGKEVSGDRNLTVSGKTDPGVSVFINDSQIIVQSDGSFSSRFSLSDGDNNITIKAQDQAGNSVEESRKVTFKP